LSTHLAYRKIFFRGRGTPKKMIDPTTHTRVPLCDIHRQKSPVAAGIFSTWLKKGRTFWSSCDRFLALWDSR
jgi:hypothetical protein